MINRSMAMAIFEKNACLVVDRDVIPERIAEELTSKEAIVFAKEMESAGFNGYGVGKLGTMQYMTQKAFLIAVTYQNVKCELESR